MLKQGGQWQPSTGTPRWSYVADGLKRVKAEFGVAGIGAVGSPQRRSRNCTCWPSWCAAGQREHRPPLPPRRLPATCRPTGKRALAGHQIASLSQLDRAFVVGSFLRKDHPLLAQRCARPRRGAQVCSLHALHDDWRLPLAHTLTAAPSAWPAALAEVAAALASAKGLPSPVARQRRHAGAGLARSLLSGQRKAVLLGNAAAQHPQAAAAGAGGLDRRTVRASVGYLGEAANAVGAQLVGALPRQGGLSAGADAVAADEGAAAAGRGARARRADAAATRVALQGAGLVVALTAFRDAAADDADVLLPIAPFTETAGSLRQCRGPPAELRRRGQARWARPARPGRCCACWATCSAAGLRSRVHGSGARRGAGRRVQPGVAAGQLCRTARCAAGADRRDRAHRRRADLLDRPAGAPGAGAAGHGRCQAAGGRLVERGGGAWGCSAATRSCSARGHARS
jgi:NADH-quinone oxidoreductase subunit G